MAGIDLTTAEAHPQTWLDAETAVANGQSFSYFGNEQVRRLSQATGIRVQQAVIYG